MDPEMERGEAAAAMEAAEGLPWNNQAQQAGDGEDVNPLNLASLFGGEQDRSKQGGPAGLLRSVAVAGAGLDDEFELKKLQVCVRIRPSVTKGAPRWDIENCIHATSKCSLAIAPPEASQAYKNGDRGHTYSFSRVFDEDTSQQEYFEGTAAPLVQDLLRNPQHNSVMMAYGITAAGKTYTIEGNAAQPGVMPRALEMLFQGLEDHAEPLSVRVAYYEVYNEQVYDLLEDAPVGPGLHRVALKLKEDNQGRVFVAGLTEVEVTSAAGALRVLRRGSKQRQRAETGLNYNSSRSHSIFTIMLYQPLEAGRFAENVDEQAEKEDEQEEQLGRMSFVDLAGSERLQRTGNVGLRLKESVAINSSLMTLGRCLEALRWNQQHKNANQFKVVPFRESKVTHLFRDALHGWGQVILSVNVSPCAKDYDETSHVLKYAALATQISTIQQAEAPRRVVKAVSPAIKKVKRKAGLPPEARGGKARIKRAKKSPQKPAALEEQPLPASPMPEEGAPVEDLAADGSSCPEYDALQKGCEREEQQSAEEAAEAAAGLQYDGTPTTPLEDDDGADNAMIAELQAQIQRLVAQLQRAEERCVMVETEVREEVAQEMEQLMREMEAGYKERLAVEVAQLEAKLPAMQQQPAAGTSVRGKGRAGKASELVDDAHSAPAATAVQWEVLLATAEQRAAKLQKQVDSLSAELGSAQQRAEEMQAALDQAAVQQEQLAQLEKQAASSQCLAGTIEQLQAELKEATAQKAMLQAELETERQRAAALESEVQEAQQALQEAALQAETVLQEELTQMGANRAMEVEMLEEQLHRAKKDNAALRQRLDAAMATLATMASPSVPLMQRIAQACPAGNGRGAGGTPHDVALARARQAAAAEELEQAAILPSAAAAARAPGSSKLVRGKASGQASRLGGMPGHLASRLVPAAVATGGGGSPFQAPDLAEHPAALAELGDLAVPAVLEQPAVLAQLGDGTVTVPADGGGEGQGAICGGWHLPEIPDDAPAEQPAPGEPAPQSRHGQEGAKEEGPVAPAAAEPKRSRRALRASAAPAPLVQQQQQDEGSAAEQPPLPTAAKAKRVRRATKAAASAVLPTNDTAQPCTDAVEPTNPTALAQLAATQSGLQPVAPGGQAVAHVQGQVEGEAAEEQPRKGGRRGGRRKAAAGKPPPESAPELARLSGEAEARAAACAAAGDAQSGVDILHSAAPGRVELEAVAARQQQQQLAPTAKGRRGRRVTSSTLPSISESAAGDSSKMAAGAAEQAWAGQRQRAAGGSRRASSARSRDKENGDESGAGAAGKQAITFEPIAEEPEEEEEAAAVAAPGPVLEQPSVELAPLQPAESKCRRKLLPVKAESKELRTALGELNDDMGMDAGAAALPVRRPRRQTTFFKL